MGAMASQITSLTIACSIENGVQFIDVFKTSKIMSFNLFVNKESCFEILVMFQRMIHNHYEQYGVSALAIFSFRRRSKETPKLRVTSLCVGNSPVTD